MEHRWGTRIPVDFAVQLEIPGRGTLPGRMINASVSGALVETSVRLSPFTEVRLIVTTPHACIELPACVSRSSDSGLALEWRDMACPTLLDILNERRGEAALTERDHAFG